jgi:hypothetical protein
VNSPRRTIAAESYRPRDRLRSEARALRSQLGCGRLFRRRWEDWTRPG